MKEIATKSGRYNPIITKAGDPLAVGFKTIDDKALQKITDFMPEVNRAVTVFSKQNSQTTSSLMTLNMIDSGPYRILRQILAQIEKKRAALKDNIYKIEKKKLDYLGLEEQQANSEVDLAWNKRQLRMDKIESDIIDAQVHIEAALKELGAYQERYQEVCKNNNIPEKWDEQDFEDAEIEHHIKSIFRNAVRDRLQGSHNMGTMEYMEQFGIEPVLAYNLVDRFIVQVRQGMESEGAPSIEMRYQFYDQMYNTFKDEYKKAMRRIGIDNVSHADWLMKENK
jgi:BMFP domain-containing protein YqiC